MFKQTMFIMNMQICIFRSMLHICSFHENSHKNIIISRALNTNLPHQITDCCRWTNWGGVTHICVCKLTISGSNIGLSPRRRQAIIWTNATILSVRPLGTYVSEILFKIQNFPWRKCTCKCRLQIGGHFCLGLNVLRDAILLLTHYCTFSLT